MLKYDQALVVNLKQISPFFLVLFELETIEISHIIICRLIVEKIHFLLERNLDSDLSYLNTTVQTQGTGPLT